MATPDLPARVRDLAGGVVAAVSGGPDSVALLRAFDAHPGPVVVAHAHHGLRGPDADADADFVAGLAARLGRPCQVTRLDVAAAGGNAEAAGRRLRYAWFAEVARAAGAATVVTGHTADDQAETVLLRLLRGTGLAGLRGIAPRRDLGGGVALARPLLDVTRADVLAFLAGLGQDYRTDATNADRSLARNRVRHDLLPLLARDYNPAAASLLARLAAQAAAAYELLETEARRLLAAAERPRAGAVLVFDRPALAAAPAVVSAEAMRLVWRREGWPLDGVGAGDWDRVGRIIAGELLATDLPGRVRVRRRGRVVQVFPVA